MICDESKHRNIFSIWYWFYHRRDWISELCPSIRRSNDTYNSFQAERWNMIILISSKCLQSTTLTNGKIRQYNWKSTSSSQHENNELFLCSSQVVKFKLKTQNVQGRCLETVEDGTDIFRWSHENNQSSIWWREHCILFSYWCCITCIVSLQC